MSEVISNDSLCIELVRWKPSVYPLYKHLTAGYPSDRRLMRGYTEGKSRLAPAVNTKRAFYTCVPILSTFMTASYFTIVFHFIIWIFNHISITV